MNSENDLIKVIKEVHSQHADDLCWMPADINKIFVAAGLSAQDLRVGDKAAMLKNCERYVQCLESGGPWVSYAELEKQLASCIKTLVEIQNHSVCCDARHDATKVLKEIGHGT